MDWNDRAKTYSALRTVLHALRDELIIEEAVDLAAQLPLILRGLYYEGWSPARTPRCDRNLDLFLEWVADNYTQSDAERIDPRWLCESVFTLLNEYISAGEIDGVKSMLFGPLQDLWPDDDLTNSNDLRQRPTSLH